MNIKDSLKKLKEIDKQISILNSTANLLVWDNDTIMPQKATEERAEQLSYIATLIHEKSTSKELIKIVNYLSKRTSKIGFIDKKIVQYYHWKISRLSKLPKEHIAELYKLIGLSQKYWILAKNNNDFKKFEPYLEKIFELKIKESKYIDPKKHPYEVLIQDYEKGMTIAVLDKLFEEIKIDLKELIEKVKKSKKYGKEYVINNKLNVETQKIIAQEIATLILEDNERFIMSSSKHPFMTKISANDLRITTDFREDPFFSLFSTAHECGHALYESEFDKKLNYTILHDSPSLGLHESQSRFWENQILKSKHFWKFYYKKYRERTSLKIPLEKIYEAINTVRPSPIRIESDELTYNMHIIIRYEIEKGLIEKKIKVSELPIIWNKLYEKYLGITPKNDSEGVLQDVHWSKASIAYFPTYTLGNIYSSMIYEQLKKEHPRLEKEISKGDFKFIKKWLKNKIHKHGSLFNTIEIIEKCCDKKIDKKPLINHYKEKFGKIYDF